MCRTRACKVCGQFLTAAGVGQHPAAIGAVIGAIFIDATFIEAIDSRIRRNIVALAPVDGRQFVRLWVGVRVTRLRVRLRLGSGIGSGKGSTGLGLSPS